MKKIAFALFSIALVASTGAFAEGKTRAQVYQELIEAQQNGLNYVTDSSYPEGNPIFAQQGAQMKQQALATSMANGKIADAARSNASPN
jgi:hypothetical protein